MIRQALSVLAILIAAALLGCAIGAAIYLATTGSLVVQLVVGIPLGVAATWLLVVLVPWTSAPHEPRLPRARVSRIADSRLDIGEALRRGDRTWRP